MPARATPTRGLLVGLIITLTAVVADSYYVSRQIGRLRALQTDLADRSRGDSLQLLRIQNDLNSLGLAMRDMLDSDEPYPLTAWSSQFQRIRTDLDDALRREAGLTVAERTPAQRQYLADSFAQFWGAADRMFALAAGGRDAEARDQIRLSLQARQAALVTAVARLLVENNEGEAETAARVQGIYAEVERQVALFLAATFAALMLTGVYLIRSNRRIFAEIAALSDERREVAQQLIAARETTLRHLARELHDEFGQTLTAIGSMLTRAARRTSDEPLQSELREIGEIAQGMLEHVRGLSQALHPSILEEVGLEGTIDWYLSTVERQTGLAIAYERRGPAPPVSTTLAIHVYRVLQEALNNAARHSGAAEAWVRLIVEPASLQLEVEDHGKGLQAGHPRGLGITTMRERAALLGGALELVAPPAGGTLVRLRVPLGGGAAERAPGTAPATNNALREVHEDHHPARG